MAAVERTAPQTPGHSRLGRVAQHLITRRHPAAPLPGLAPAAAAGTVALSIAQGPARALGPADFIMGSPGNWQTEDGIVLNEEERAIETLTAAMRSGIEDFVRISPCPALPPGTDAHHLFANS